MRPENEGALRTRVYVDGYNLYYGCLKNTADKWLDLRALVERVLANVPYERSGEPVSYEFCAPAIKYFTAPILSSFARSEDSVACPVVCDSRGAGNLRSLSHNFRIKDPIHQAANPSTNDHES